MKADIPCEVISWQQVHHTARCLARQIREDGFTPDIVVAIARGGYVPARLLCDFLDIGPLTSIRIEHYSAGARMQRQARLSLPLGTDVHGLRVLIADDVSDTGDTLTLALEHINGFRPKAVRTAVLDHKQVSSIEPDYFGCKILNWRWLTYPWALLEDTTGFIRALDSQPRDVAEAGRRLHERHGIELDEQVLADALAMLG